MLSRGTNRKKLCLTCTILLDNGFKLWYNILIEKEKI